jgi:hypothetical protein
VRRAAAERRLILLSAGTRARRRSQREVARQLVGRVDWDALTATLYGRRLLPTLGPRIVELAEGRAGGEFSSQVERAVEQARRQGAFLHLLSERVEAALREAGLHCAPLKGPRLAEAIYGDPGRRLAGDIDLLVPAEELADALAVVGRFGYAPPIDHVEADGLPQLHFAMAHADEELPPVELHWRIHWYERRFAAERLLPPIGVAAGWRPEPVDELAALLLFYARDGFVDLRLATDVGAWFDRHGDAVAVADFQARLDRYPALRRPLLAAAVAAQRVVGLPAEDLLGHQPLLGWRGRLAVRLADPNPNPRWRHSQMHAAMGLVDGLLTPRGELGEFVRRQVLLPRGVLDERALKAEGVQRSRVGHGIRSLARLGFAGARLARRPAAF